MNKVDKIYYYHMRDAVGRPVITVCVMKMGNKFARGVAICSPYEMPIKKEGRRHARNRAYYALFNDVVCDPILRDEAIAVLEVVENITDAMVPFDYKTESLEQYDLTEFEQRLFEKRGTKN